jgi:hypothetical protein
VTNGGQKYMNADCDCYTNQRQQADGYQKNAEDFGLATADYQHRGLSVPAAATLRNVTDMGYGGADDLP